METRQLHDYGAVEIPTANYFLHNLFKIILFLPVCLADPAKYKRSFTFEKQEKERKEGRKNDIQTDKVREKNRLDERKEEKKDRKKKRRK